MRRAEVYRRQTGRKAPSPKQRRRLDQKSRKRFGFVSWAWYAPLRGPIPAMTPEEKWRQRHVFAGSLLDPKAIAKITGTGL